MQLSTFTPTQTQHRMAEAQTGNVCAVFRLEGPLEPERLGRAVHQVVAAATPLRFRYMRINQSLHIVLSREADDDWRVVDAAGGVFALIAAYCNHRFRLDGGAPYHFSLLRSRDDVHYLVFACHPALLDLFSLRPLFAALSQAYNGAPLPELGFPQEDLLAAERATSYDESVRFWLHQVHDTSFEWHPPRLEGDLHDSHLERSFPATALHRLSDTLGIPVNDLLLFAFHLFMARLSRNDTVLTTYRHRIRSLPEDRIGCNENKPAFKSVLDRDVTVRQYLRRSARLMAHTRYHADLPAREIASELKRREPQFQRITNVLFGRDPLPYGELALDGLTCTLLPEYSHRLETEDVAVYTDVRDDVTLHLLTRSPQEAAGLAMVIEHYGTLLARLPDALDLPVGSVPLFDGAMDMVDGGPLLVAPRDVMVQFAEVAARQPRAVAVRCGERHLTYGELARSARCIAAALHVDGECRIGICLPRGTAFIEAILGVLGAGAAYVPLDPAMPAERLAFIMRDARLNLTIVDPTTRHLVSGPTWEIDAAGDEADFVAVEPSRAAYVIYTSGTTGRPKGVVLERGNLAHLLAAVEGLWDRGPGARWLQFAAFTFDASVLGIFNPLSRGAELIVTPSEVRTDPESLFRLLQEARITHADLPPALLAVLPRRPLPHLKAIFCGGEAIDEEAARFWSAAVELSNCYGPTEATVMATRNVLG
ncbi:MAG: AMP-binding protein, partial [Candidatus Xenobia bacterium]